MIRGIVAIDSKRGMANDRGIPWDIPGDRQYFVDHLSNGRVLMGYGTYTEVETPFGTQDNYVATHREEALRPGFVRVADVSQFLAEATDDVWNIGGPGLLANTLDMLDELYVTQVEGDFHCTKFLPDFHELFRLTYESEPQRENDTTYHYQVWTRRN